ncbi:MAG TPA: TIGR01777 family oxidoreductase [Acidimicrobiia bacterium]
MDVAITGASGLIGTALAPALARDGHRVVRVVRRDPAGADEIGWDPAAGKIDAAGLEGVDAVVHLAGVGIGDKKWTPERKREILESRTQGTSLIADTLANLERKPGVLVSASGVDYYGAHGDEELTEDSPAGTGFLAEVCVAWEAATAPAEQGGIRVVRLRTGPVLSADGGVLKRMLFPFKVGLGGRIGTGKQWMSWISIVDHVGAIRHVLGRGDIAGPVNSTAPHPVTNAEYTKTLGRVVRRPTPIPTPMAPLKVLYGMELVHHLLLTGQRVVPRRLLDSGFRFEQPDLEQALRALLGKPAA